MDVRLSPMSVTRVRNLVLSDSCGFSLLLVFSGFTGFSPSIKKSNTFQFQFDLDVKRKLYTYCFLSTAHIKTLILIYFQT